MKRFAFILLLAFCFTAFAAAEEEQPSLSTFLEGDFRGIWTEHPDDSASYGLYHFNPDGSFELEDSENPVSGTWEYWSHNMSLQVFDEEGLYGDWKMTTWDGFMLTLEDREGHELYLYKLESF